MKIKRIIEEESGAVMVEASIYFPFVVLIMGFIIVLSIFKINKIGALAKASNNAYEIQCMADTGHLEWNTPMGQCDSRMTTNTILTSTGSNKNEAYWSKNNTLNPMHDYEYKVLYKTPGFVRLVFRGTNYESSIPTELASTRTLVFIQRNHPKCELTRVKLAENYSGAEDGIIRAKTGYSFEEYMNGMYYDFYFVYPE